MERATRSAGSVIRRRSRAAILVLASPLSAYLTGKILEVDGGIDRPNLDLGIPDL
jgi:NAD(P)-dependent dehydrogenase (short-subunit alcohol dehydrogenase family)